MIKFLQLKINVNKAGVICLFLMIFTSLLLSGCSSNTNKVTLVNDIKTDQSIYLHCHPRDVICPRTIPKNKDVIIHGVDSLTIVYHQKIKEIMFEKSGDHVLKLKDILLRKKPLFLKGQCKTFINYELNKTIDCNKIN